MTEDSHDVVVVGAEAVATELLKAGITGFTLINHTLVSSVFDDEIGAWRLITGDGQTCKGRVVIVTESPFTPWIPNLAGHNDFEGTVFHAATPEPDFDPAGQRIAVIGGDAAAGQLVDRLTRSAASVKVFPLPPRRVVTPARRRSHYLRRRPEVVESPIDSLTTSGIRSADGTDHETDTIIYGTGYTIRDDEMLIGTGGVTIQQTWVDGVEPYLGIALHGFPNYFVLDGPDLATAVHYVAECLKLLRRATNTRIEVRRSSQQVFNERVHLHTPPRRLVASAFEVWSPGGDDTYDGPATLIVAGIRRQVRVRLAGHVDPIDGQYHWQGTVFEQLSPELLKQTRAAELRVGQRSASARITEETPQGTHSIVGVGTPPFALPQLELTSWPA